MSEHFQRAQILLSQERYELAAKELRQELATNPDDAVAHSLLAICLSQLEQNAQALEEAHTGIAHGPHLSFSHYVLAKILLNEDRFAEAANAAAEAIRLDPDDADNFALLATIKLQQKDWTAALAAAETGVEISPEHTGCANLRALALVKLGRKDEAGETIYATLALDPENAFTHANQGWAYLHRSQVKEALEHFQAALRIDPEMEWARQGMIEALKAKYILYRWMLRYFLWMGRLSDKAQWGVMIGIWIGQRLLRNTADTSPQLAPFIWPVLIVLMAFTYLTWAADSFFNLLLRLNPFGRLMLSREQIQASNWTGGLLLTALLSLLAWIVTQHPTALILAIGSLVMVIPASGVLRQKQGGKRIFLLVYACGLAALWLFAITLSFTAGMEAAWGPIGLFAIGIFFYSLIASALATRTS